jgi:hypothetical protein
MSGWWEEQEDGAECVSGDAAQLQSTEVFELIGCEGVSNAELMGDVMRSSPTFD